ncbi:hypothetical protein AB0L06_17075 [Spirillospora sp. NPDC052269]
MTPTDDQVRELVRRFVTLDMTGWDDAAFDRALVHLGWSPRQDAVEERFPGSGDYDTGLGTGYGSCYRHGAGDEPCVAHEFPALGDEEAETAARMLVGALRSHGVDFDDLWHELISAQPDLLGIGIPTRRGARF